jgi:hypothetical protein
MPTISSISGTYGYGRAPQNLPEPAIEIYPQIGTRRLWNLSTNGPIVFEGNSSPLIAGNCFVLTPNTDFSVRVKLWGAGGGSTNGGVTTFNVDNNQVAAYSAYGTQAVSSSGSGGMAYGKIDLLAGQSYTIFAGASGKESLTITTGAGGGAASGILLGNVFAISAIPAMPLLIAGGGGGSNSIAVDSYIMAGAGGGNITAGFSTQTTTVGYASTTNGASSTGSGLSGIPNQYNGGTSGTSGGGGGGIKGGVPLAGGLGNVAVGLSTLQSLTGTYSITPYYDDSTRGTAGDSNRGGRAMIYFDEYTISNITATGGTITSVPIPGYDLAYRYHTFTANDKFTVSSAGKNSAIDVFVVGGGGGGTLLSGGGGGGVAFRSNLNIGVGTYLVDIGTGGSKANTSIVTNSVLTSKGGIYGGIKGNPSAFYTNNLSTRGWFTDPYIKLIHSFGGAIRYINPAGDDTNGLTIVTGYSSIQSAIQKNLSYTELIVFVVLPGVYTENVSNTGAASPTPVHDYNKPRIFVCAPGKVTIDWAPSASIGNSPICQLAHPMSAVYGAIFNRNGYTKDDAQDPSSLAFFNFTNTNLTPNATFPAIFRGSLYNCVIKDTGGDWGLFPLNNNVTPWMSFKIENCSFTTARADVSMTTDNKAQTSNKILLKNCVFQKSFTWSVPESDNVAQNATFGTKFVATAHPDKGVYAGEFSWSGTITVPTATTKLLAIVGHGGGGGTIHTFLGLANCAGGSGGGTEQPLTRAPSTQYNKEAMADYSGYGNPGGISSRANGVYSGGGAGGGAGFHGVDISSGGGVGIEFPTRSGVFYGTGGAGRVTPTQPAVSTRLLAPGEVGRGGDAGTDSNSNGKDGIVIVRYIVSGPYTDTTITTVPGNIIAYGGNLISDNIL